MSDKKYSAPETLEEFKLTRDFEYYLDMLNPLKSKYMIIMCLKSTAGQNIPEKTVEKIRSLGFHKFATEPDMKYVGVLSNGSTVRDSSSEEDKQPLEFELSVSKKKIFISFDEKEAEIKIDGKEQSLNDKGLNIVVYDLKKSETVDACCYDASENNPTFYHRNFCYDDKYTDSHIYMPRSFMDSVTLPIKKSYFSPRSLNVTEVERGIFLPNQGWAELDANGKETGTYRMYGGICDESFNFIAGHQLFRPKSVLSDDRHISGSYRVEPEDITYIDERVLYGGTLIEHPGHLITECFADRLWWLAENADSDIKIAVQILLGNSEFSTNYNSFVMEFLDAFGISKERLFIVEKPTQFKSIIVPDQSAINLNFCSPYEFTKEYIKPFQHITKRLTPGEYKKIYLTKSKLPNKSTIGEEYFIDYFEKKGFKIIHPEDYTIKEKAELMYGADEVVTIDGTNSLFTVFCKPSVKLTILARRMDYWDFPQQLINEALGIKDFFLVNVSGSFLEQFSDKGFFNYARGLVLTYPTKEFKQYVKYAYNEELDITPDESFKQHLYDYLAYFSEYYTDPTLSLIVNNIKMTDILRGMSEVFRGKALDTGDLNFVTDDELLIRELKSRLLEEKKSNGEKIQLLSDKAKGFIDEITRLKQTLAQREAEIERLRRENSELSSYMAEIGQLLDALEAGNGQTSE